MILSKNDPGYQQCSLSVMDNIADPNIKFDVRGICNYYYQYLNKEKNFVFKGNEGRQKLELLLSAIKAKGKNKKYNCILGISGGVDSTYLAFKAREWGLNPLLVHFDNGWNSELAVKNIENIVTKTGFDLYTFVVDWNEYKDIQKSFFKANVIDIEAVMDIGFINTLQIVNKKYDIGYVIDGQNVVTEGLLPDAWIYKNQDNLINIHKMFGHGDLKTYPLISPFRQYLFDHFYRLKYISPLNYIEYDKEKVKEVITNEFGWRDYGGKHYESVFTRFYQGYILPEKFKVDKRKAHLSNLIFSKQLSKEQAIEDLKTPIYPEELLRVDKPFVLKKLDFTEEEFIEYIDSPAIAHSVYGSFIPFFDKYPALKPLKFISNAIKKFNE
ncbi:MAG TPA: N-acetyl sugar amidotransferase [Puia sp.]|nr:N-acetyl sugar amidotransferase [Puia sp.]